MKKRAQEWLAVLRSAYPSASSSYWRALPLRRLRKLLIGTFLIASAVGFSTDVPLLSHKRLGGGFFWPVFAGTMTPGVLAAQIKVTTYLSNQVRKLWRGLPQWLLGDLAFLLRFEGWSPLALSFNHALGNPYKLPQSRL
ncbi:MAG TPA: hypothetical protein VKM93_18755 [Terriglobia bacterium]|nr:hypothetical protein [Terriglobia bacterium]